MTAPSDAHPNLRQRELSRFGLSWVPAARCDAQSCSGCTLAGEWDESIAMNNTHDEWAEVLNSVADVDELYSNLLYMPPVEVLMSDGRILEVWVTFDDETLQIRHLDVPCDDGWWHEPASFEDAYSHLGGGTVLPGDSTSSN